MFSFKKFLEERGHLDPENMPVHQLMRHVEKTADEDEFIRGMRPVNPDPEDLFQQIREKYSDRYVFKKGLTQGEINARRANALNQIGIWGWQLEMTPRDRNGDEPYVIVLPFRRGYMIVTQPGNQKHTVLTQEDVILKLQDIIDGPVSPEVY